VAHRLHRYDHDPSAASYGAEAAEAMGVEPARVFKTLVCATDRAAVSVVAVVPVDRTLDLKALAAVVGAKSAALAEVAAAERSTGYVVGAISPLGQKRRLATLVDQTAEDWPTMFVSGGRRGLEIELAPADLLDLTGGTLAAIARLRL
jgi:Cys-tRNA(Pro)/Cys-tRNA(Cys) deacylase